MSTLRHQFDWLPDPLGSILLLCATALIALLLSRRITGTLPRLPGLRKVQFIHAIINRVRVNISYFLIIIAASAALLATEGFSPKTETFLAHALACLFIMNLGFGIIRAFRLITDQYLNRISSRETWMTSRSAPIRRRSMFWGV